MISGELSQTSKVDYPNGELFVAFEELQAMTSEQQEALAASGKVVIPPEVKNPIVYFSSNPFRCFFVEGNRAYKLTNNRIDYNIYDKQGDLWVFKESKTISSIVYEPPDDLQLEAFTQKHKMEGAKNMAEDRNLESELDQFLTPGGDDPIITGTEEKEVQISSAFDNVGDGGSAPDTSSVNEKMQEILQRREQGIARLRQQAIPPTVQSTWNYMRKHGRLVCFITKEDAKIVFTTQKDFLKENEQFVKNPDVSEAEFKEYVAYVNAGGARKRGNQGKKFKAKNYYYKQQYKPVFKFQKPKGMYGGVIMYPENGLVNPTDLYSENFKGITETPNPDKVYKTFVYQDLSHIITDRFGGELQEHEDVVAPFTDTKNGLISAEKASVFTVRRVEAKTTTGEGNAPKVVGGVPVEEFKTYIVHKYRKSSLVTPMNYIPLETYETMNISGEISAEDAQNLNIWYVLPLTKVSSRSPVSKYHDLLPDYASHISFDEENNEISSRYFTPDVQKRITPQIDHWYNRGRVPEYQVDTINIATRQPARQQGKFEFVKHKLAETGEHTLKDPRWAHLVKIFGDSITEADLLAVEEKFRSEAAKAKAQEKNVYEGADLAVQAFNYNKARLNDRDLSDLSGVVFAGVSDPTDWARRAQEELEGIR